VNVFDMVKMYRPAFSSNITKENLITDHKRVTNTFTDENRPTNLERCNIRLN
jgi:hypothetical protein